MCIINFCPVFTDLHLNELMCEQVFNDLMVLLFIFGQMYSIMLQHSSNLIKSLQKKVEADEVIEVKE